MAAAGFTFVKGSYDQEELLAQAALADLKAAKQKLVAQAEEDREEIETIVEAQARCAKAVVQVLETDHRAAMAALRRQS